MPEQWSTPEPTAVGAVVTVRNDDITFPDGIHPTIGTFLPGSLVGGSDGGSGAPSNSEKMGATLLFSGIFMTLVGMTFTAMGWLNFDHNHNQDWGQLLGPILLTMGGTFILISICKFRLLTCEACSHHQDDEADVQQPGQTFNVFNGISAINQPILLQGATVMQYIPPPYASFNQEVSPANGVGVPLPPQYYTVCPVDNQGISGGEGYIPHTAADHREPERRLHQYNDKDSSDSTATCPPPPAYEDIYPPL